MVLAWAALGALLGAALRRPTRRLLHSHRDHPLIATPTLATGTAILFGLLAWRHGTRPDLLADSALAAVAVPLAAIDTLEHRLPAGLTNPAYPAVVASLALAAAVDHNGAALLRALAGMTILFCSFLLIALASAGSLGAGDVRLAGLLGLALGWPAWTTLITGTGLGLLYGALTGATLITVRRGTRHTSIPLGPALLAGAFTALLLPTG